MYVYILECGDLKVVVCLNKAPRVGSIVKPTRGNVYMGGCPGIPIIKDSPMVGREWKVLEETEGAKTIVLKVTEVK